MYRREGSQGHLLDLAPALALPLNFDDYLMLEPRITWRPQLFSFSAMEDDELKANGFSNDINFTLDASTYLYNVYDWSSETEGAFLKHSLRPRLTYGCQSAFSGDNLPWLLSNREHKYHRISYGLENAFTLKTLPPAQEDNSAAAPARQEQAQTDAAPVPAPGDRFIRNSTRALLDPAGNLAPAKGDARYNEFMRLNLAHAFYFDPYLEDYSNEERNWGNIEGRLELRPFADYGLYLTLDTAYDVYRNDFDEITVQLSTHSQRGDYIALDYSNRAYDILRSNYQRVHQINGTLHVNIGYGASLTFETRYDLERSIRFDQTLALNYNAQCWGVSFIFYESEREQAFYLAFSLAGILNLGGH
jgi:hypothetical protein